LELVSKSKMDWLHFILTWTVLCCTAQANSLDSGDGMLMKLEVVQDVWVEDSGNKNDAEFAEWLIVGKHRSYPKKRSLVQFEEITKCDCAVEKLSWAKMYLYFEYTYKSSWLTVDDAPFTSRPLWAHLVKEPWNESEATNNHRMNGVKWGSPWLGIDDVDAEMIPQDYEPTIIYASRPKGYVEFDVTRAVQKWLGGKPNFGLLIWALDENTDTRDIRFWSSESDDEGKHPFLNVMCDYK